MSKYIYIVFSFIFIIVFCFKNCDRSDDGDEMIEDTGTQATLKFIPKMGTELVYLVGMPDVEWSFDTIRGLCSPDTLMLWVKYDGIEYPTSVIGVGDRFKTMTATGEKRLLRDGLSAPFVKTDFTPSSVVTSSFGLTRAEFNELNDTLYKYESDRLIRMVKDFFISKGDIEYMSKAMAVNWDLIYQQANIQGASSTNPLNHAARVDFDPESIIVSITNPKNGVLEVAAYCTDPYTVGGRPGWAYWTVKACRENGSFKIKENPAQHRQFTN